jgi:hypothetical protein
MGEMDESLVSAQWFWPVTVDLATFDFRVDPRILVYLLDSRYYPMVLLFGLFLCLALVVLWIDKVINRTDDTFGEPSTWDYAAELEEEEFEDTDARDYEAELAGQAGKKLRKRPQL